LDEFLYAPGQFRVGCGFFSISIIHFEKNFFVRRKWGGSFALLRTVGSD